MIRVVMVCHGNICRSPMAEFVLKDLINKNGLSGSIAVDSAAVSSEELGSPVHKGTAKILNACGIDCSRKRARKLTREQYENSDYVVVMDKSNLHFIDRLFGGSSRARLLMEYAAQNKEIADPWYTNDFNAAYRDVFTGCSALLERIRSDNKI